MAKFRCVRDEQNGMLIWWVAEVGPAGEENLLVNFTVQAECEDTVAFLNAQAAGRLPMKSRPRAGLVQGE